MENFLFLEQVRLNALGDSLPIPLCGLHVLWLGVIVGLYALFVDMLQDELQLLRSLVGGRLLDLAQKFRITLHFQIHHVRLRVVPLRLVWVVQGLLLLLKIVYVEAQVV